MSAIYGYRGGHADSLTILWLAAPVTGVIIQPLIGQSRLPGFTLKNFLPNRPVNALVLGRVSMGLAGVLALLVVTFKKTGAEPLPGVGGGHKRKHPVLGCEMRAQISRSDKPAFIYLDTLKVLTHFTDHETHLSAPVSHQSRAIAFHHRQPRTARRRPG